MVSKLILVFLLLLFVMKIIEDFNKLSISNYFRKEYEEISMAIRLAEDIMGIKNIRSAGDEVEIAVRKFYSEKLYPKYFVGKGHIIDRNLSCSPNYDIIIAENSKNPVLFKHQDGDSIVFFETVYSVIEVKKSLYSDDLISNFINQIKKTKEILERENIAPNFIETSNSGFYVNEKLTEYPLRNRLLFFMFIGESNKLSFPKLKEITKENTSLNMPNFIVFLDQGLLVNINEKEYKEKGLIRVNLYPEYESEGMWAFLSIDDPEKVLMFQYLLLMEHLNDTIVSIPELSVYTNKIFNLNNNDITPL